ncbi:hypothetical protein F0562_019211 [Nyssa sinensis]|uniref:Ripening-related protein 1 n=1 Tax=Nyssa sinensis TaxID=561372 RepID=A0A5J4ZEB5_9ASTE|nr:hypothetical protein F0562_019211 [Nyssa sinensis]
MRKQACSSTVSFLIFFLLLVSIFSIVEAKTCKPSGKIKGKKPPEGECNQQNGSDCCEEGKLYTTYKCSPKVSGLTKAVLTINSFEKDGDGGGPSECDNKFHSDKTMVVALSTGWFNKEKRCFNNITIYGNGKRVKAMVVDECDSTQGCDDEHDYQPPCPNNIVDGSEAVWKALGVPTLSEDSLFRMSAEVLTLMDLLIQKLWLLAFLGVVVRNVQGRLIDGISNGVVKPSARQCQAPAIREPSSFVASSFPPEHVVVESKNLNFISL